MKAPSIYYTNEKLRFALDMCEKYNSKHVAWCVINDIITFMPDGHSDKRQMMYVADLIKDVKTPLYFNTPELIELKKQLDEFKPFDI